MLYEELNGYTYQIIDNRTGDRISEHVTQYDAETELAHLEDLGYRVKIEVKKEIE